MRTGQEEASERVLMYGSTIWSVSENFVESPDLPACLFCRAAAQVAARCRGKSLRFLHGCTVSAAFRSFFIELLCFAGRTALFVKAQNLNRPFDMADCKFECVARAQFAGRFDRMAV